MDLLYFILIAVFGSTGIMAAVVGICILFDLPLAIKLNSREIIRWSTRDSNPD
jgi:hypothetical protein